jgi:hypothetical protein
MTFSLVTTLMLGFIQDEKLIEETDAVLVKAVTPLNPSRPRAAGLV